MAENIVTPVGDLTWVFINGNVKKDQKGNERYVASLELHKDSKEFKQIEKTIKDFWAENKPKNARLKSNGIRIVQTKVEGQVDENGDQLYEDTDMMSINFWTGTKYPDGKAKVIKTYTAKGSEVALGDKKIGNGSRGAISGAMGIYDREDGKGITLFLNAIQITKFVEYTGGDAGFSDTGEEDGFNGFTEESDGFGAQPEEGSAPPRL